MTRYYDPLFYICSEQMPFTIRLSVTLHDPVDAAALEEAAQEAVKRFPYFSVRVIRDKEEYRLEPNPLPLCVIRGRDVPVLGSSAVNFHLTALACFDNTIEFYFSHVMTDGAGSYPFLKTVLYGYLCRRYQVKPDPSGIELPSSPFYPDETGNPYPEEAMKEAKAFYTPKERPFFRLRDGGYVTDHQATMFRFRIPEKEVMRFSHENDGSPCALLSSLMTQAVRDIHPETEKDIVSAISFNLRPGLGNRHSYRMLCSALRLFYPVSLRDADITRLCTCTRGMITLQSQPENVLAYAEQLRIQSEALCRIPDLKTKKDLLGAKALADACNNTFSVSYVGKMDLGCLEPYLESIYNVTDGSTYETAFLEIAAVNGWFNISLLQSFSSDIYYKALLNRLSRYRLTYREESREPMRTPRIELP